MPFAVVESAQLYARDPNLKEKDVEILQEWLKKQPHLPQITESQIIIVLHSCYYRVEAAKITIDNYFTCRNLCPEIFQAMAPDLLRTTANVVFINTLPKKTPEGYGVVMMKFTNTKTDNFNCANCINLANMVWTLDLHTNGFDKGIVAVLDAKGFSLGHLARLNVNVIKHALYFIQEAVPVRIKGVHIINTAPVVDKVVALVKPFLKGELYKMLQFYPPGSDGFYQSVPKECFPEEYGGQSPSIQVLNEACLKKILDNYDFYNWHDSQKVDESKRMGKSKVASEIFGADGTFKKLEID